jgi:hypothetical protein
MTDKKNLDEFSTVILPGAFTSPEEVPLVIYRNHGDGERRQVIGTAKVREIDDGLVVDCQITDQLTIEWLNQDMTVEQISPFEARKT